MQTRTRNLLLVAALLCGGLHSSLAQTTGKEEETKWIEVLKSNAEFTAKADACRELGRVGTADAVPALAALLGDEKLSHMARYGLEPIPGPAVDAALRDALGKLKGRLLVGVIGSVGVRHDEKALPALAAFLKDPDAEVAQAAARAMGTIGTPDAVKKLQAALPAAAEANRLAFCEGVLRGAEALAAKGQKEAALAAYDSLWDLKGAPHQVRAAAARGLILTKGEAGVPELVKMLQGNDPALVAAATRIAIEMPGAGVAKAVAGILGKVPAERQVVLCNVLGCRADEAALPELLGLAKAGDKAARVAAIKAVAEIGKASSAAPLMELLKDSDGDVTQAAAASLSGLHGSDVDAAVVKTLQSTDPALKRNAIEIIRQRRIVAALPVLLASKDDKDEAVRAAAMKCFAELAGEGELAGLLEQMVKSTNAAEINALEKALGTICGGVADPKSCAPKLVAALPKANPEAKAALVRTLAVAGGPEALQAVRGAVNDANKDVHSSAIRVLAVWKSPDVAPVLLELAKSSTEAVDKILALRGYLGLATRKDLSPADKLAICRGAAPMIQRDDEKRLLLGALTSLADAQSLDLIVAYLDDAAVQREAATTVVAIAEKRPKGQHAEITKTALEKAAKAAADNPAVANKAAELLKQLAAEK